METKQAIAITSFLSLCAMGYTQTSGEVESKYYKETDSRIEIERVIFDILQKKLGAPLNQIKYSGNLVLDYGADSLDVVEVIIETEKAFDIIITDGFINSISTVGELINVTSQVIDTRVVIFSDKNFTGDKIKLEGGTFISNISLKASSMLIPKEHTVKLYERENFKGNFIELKSDKKQLMIFNMDKVKGNESFISENISSVGKLNKVYKSLKVTKQ